MGDIAGGYDKDPFPVFVWRQNKWKLGKDTQFGFAEVFWCEVAFIGIFECRMNNGTVLFNIFATEVYVHFQRQNYHEILLCCQ